MAGLWSTIKDSARAFVYGSPNFDLSLARRAVTIAGYDQYQGVSYGYANRTPGYALHANIRAGMLVSGPGATDLYRDAMYGDNSNSLVAACLFRLATDVSQVPLEVARQTKPDEFDPVPDHPLASLLETPNPFMSGLILLWWTRYVEAAHGNAYWRKIRAGDSLTGNVVELWPISPEKMAPVTYKGTGDFISAYRYWYDGSRYEDIPVENVVHFRHGLDDGDHRLGCSQLRKVLKQVATDEQIAKWLHNLLANGAQPGLAVMVDKDMTLTPQQRTEFRDYINETFGGEGVGGTALIQGGNSMERVSLSPKDMDLAPLAALGESRICAIFSVPPQTVGAKVGLEHATYSNYDQSDESYTQQAILPSLRNTSTTLTRFLLPDFTNDLTLRVRADVSRLRALADDQDALTTRIVAQWEAGLIRQNEARSALGYDPLGTEGDTFKAVAPPPQLAQDDGTGTPPPPAGQRFIRLDKHSPNYEPRSVAQDRVETLLRASREEETDRLKGQADTYLAGQRRRVASRVEVTG